MAQPSPTPELLAPAGQPDAGYAALHYGADAVYLGLGSFSARAEAVNFTPDELAEFAAYAHSLPRPRKVYLTLNTLVKQTELPAAADTLLAAAECGVDAVIIQDLGVAKLARERFPTLHLHASTQMAIHSLEGAMLAKQLGFSRVTLARELTLDEVRSIAAESGIEVETFIHGTLCYSYSGLCLFSSMVTGRSGNRGRCVYSCREGAETPDGFLHPFSLKDMALGERVLDLARAGVASLKIEGRKKSPLYVAATVDYYRRILDGRMTPEEAPGYEARLQTIFARPWTRLFLDGTFNPSAADTDVVGHRGAPIGRVEGVARTPAGPAILFRPEMPVERHDGLQVDIPGESRPYGFGIDNLYAMKKGKPEPVFAVPAGDLAAAALPDDAPPMTAGLPLYQSSSQEVKRSYPYDRPKAGAYGILLLVDIDIGITNDTGEDGVCLVRCSVSLRPPAFMTGGETAIAASRDFRVASFPAREKEGAEQAARKAFERMGGSRFQPGEWRFANPDGVYVRPGDWNGIRRDLLADLENAYQKRLASSRDALHAELRRKDIRPPSPTAEFTWSIAVDSPEALAHFSAEDFTAADEVIVAFAPGKGLDGIEALRKQIGGDKLRLAIPPIWREPGGEKTAQALVDAGWRRWLIANTGVLPWFTGKSGCDLAGDWPLYVLNHLAAEQLLGMGLSSFTLSPEDEADNMRELLSSYPEYAHVPVYSDIPLFFSAACAHSHLRLCRDGTAAGTRGCRHSGTEMTIRLEKSGKVHILSQSCGSVVVGDTPYSLMDRLDELRTVGARHLRVDLRWRRRKPAETAALWRTIRSGAPVTGTEGNFDRGLI